MKSVASERGRYRAACRDYANDHNRNAKRFDWLMAARGSFPNLHMRRAHPGLMREFRRDNPRRLSRAERKAKSEYKGYAPLMDGTRTAIPKWLQRKAVTPDTGAGGKG